MPIVRRKLAILGAVVALGVSVGACAAIAVAAVVGGAIRLDTLERNFA